MSKQEHYGICHICGKYGKLSYEHIPPQSAFNNRKRKMSTRINTKTGKIDVFSEISTFPIGFIFYNITDTIQFYGCDITSFSQCNYNLEYRMDIPIPFLECNTPFGLDFRKF